MEAGGNGMLAGEASVGSTLEFLGVGPTGAIIEALGPRPLRTRRLTEQVPTYTPRTVYRHTRSLAERELIDRQETVGVPSSVLYSLSCPIGRELVRHLNSYTAAAVPRLVDPRSGDGIWTAIGLIGEMWGAGWVDEMSRGGLSVTGLSEATPEMTFHQVSRRTQQLVSWDLLSRRGGPGQRKRYQLTDRARQGMALVAAIGHWRRRHASGGDRGLTVREMTVLLRTCLPLIELPDHPGMSVKLGIVGTSDAFGRKGSETLSGSIGMDGQMRSVKEKAKPDSWALCTVDAWFAAILDGDRGRIRVGGNLDLVDDCLRQLYEVLWTDPAELPVATLN